MDWYKLDHLQRMAMDRKKNLFAWKPVGLEDDQDRYVLDPEGNNASYSVSSPYSFKASIFFSGNALIRKPDGTETLIDAPAQEPIPQSSTETFELIINGDRRKIPERGIFRSMTFDDAKALEYGDHPWVRLNNGRTGQIKVNGKVRLWARDKDRIEIPCKYGMYEYFTFTRRDIDRLLIRIS
jgi:hypothetical protein